jgi:hypothetical protein
LQQSNILFVVQIFALLLGAHFRTRQFFKWPFVDKSGLFNRYTSKKSLASIFTLGDIAKIPPKLKLQKMDIS